MERCCLFWVLCLYASLTQSALSQPCETLLDSPAASVRNCAGVHVVRLSGKPVDRAHAMGELLAKKYLSPDVIDYFSGKVGDSVSKQAGWLSLPFTLIYNQLIRFFHRATPVFLQEEVDAMALGMGIDPIALRRGFSLADTDVLLQGLGNFPMLSFLPAAGCTSVASKGTDGKFVLGRNLDFVGVGVWDKHPMLLSVEPLEGNGELSHLVIGADGLLFGGITGINEAGIAFAVHQNYTTDAGVTGMPMIFIGELVLRQAHNLDEAEKILSVHRPAALWTFVISDLKSGEIRAVESSQKTFLSRRGEGRYFVQTNHAMHPETRETENASTGIESNSIFRMKHAFEALESRPTNDAAALAAILAFQEDPEGRLSAYHDVLKAETVQTVFFDAGPGSNPRLFLSVDEAPASSGRFAVFSLNEFWKKGVPDPFVEITDLVHTPPMIRKTQRQIAEAFWIYFDEQRPLDAAQLLDEQRTLDAALFRSVAQFSAGHESAALHETESALREIHFLAEPSYIRSSLQLIRLAALLRMKRMDDARSLAQDLLEKELEKNPGTRIRSPLIELCQNILRGQHIPARKLRFSFDFFSGDLNGRKNQLD